MKLSKWLIGGTTAVAVVTVALWVTGTLSLVPAWVSVARDDIRKNVPTEVLIQEAEQALESETNRFVDYSGNVKDVAGKEKAAREAVAKLTKESAEMRDQLAKDRDALNSSDDTFLVSGKTVTRKEVSEGAKIRLAQFKNLEAKLQGKQQEVALLTASREKGEQVLEDLKKAITERKQLLAELREKHKIAEQMAKVKEMTKSVDEMTSTEESTLNKDLKEIQRRIDKLNMKTEGIAPVAKPVDWKEKADTTEDKETVKSLDEVLKSLDDKADSVKK